MSIFRYTLVCAAVGVLMLLPSTAVAQPIFHFGFTSLDSGYNAGTSIFTTSVDKTNTMGAVTRDLAPVTSAAFVSDAFSGAGYGWTLQGGDFSITMALSNITATTADATGSFTITDIDGDTITGNIAGEWTNGASNEFAGSLSNVAYNASVVGETTFDGHQGSMSTAGFPLSPWHGTLIELSSSAVWFLDGSYEHASASVDADVVPVPGAVVLGGIGLGLIGWIKRRYA